MIQTYINHIAFVIDRSSSMRGISRKTVEVFDAEIKNLKQTSVDRNQETRISVYLFGNTVDCLVFDMDVMRMESLSKYYKTEGMTALLDGTGKAIEEIKKLPELYGDHAFLVYVLTDGEENHSRRYNSRSMTQLLNELPENWTIICMVPDARGIANAKSFGFPAQNIQVWDTTERGLETVGKTFRSAMDNYMTMRANGVRGTKNFFSLKTDNLKATAIKKNLEELKPTEYKLFNIGGKKAIQIKPFVESWMGEGTYVIGSAYYELMKTEHIQAQKQICIQNKSNGKVYAGSNARQMLGLPDHEVKVKPEDFGDWRIYVQSTSVNRNLIPGTQLLVRTA